MSLGKQKVGWRLCDVGFGQPGGSMWILPRARVGKEDRYFPWSPTEMSLMAVGFADLRSHQFLSSDYKKPVLLNHHYIFSTQQFSKGDYLLIFIFLATSRVGRKSWAPSAGCIIGKQMWKWPEKSFQKKVLTPTYTHTHYRRIHTTEYTHAHVQCHRCLHWHRPTGVY